MQYQQLLYTRFTVKFIRLFIKIFNVCQNVQNSLQYRILCKPKAL